MRAAAQRRVLVVDAQRDLGLAVGVSSISSTLPTGWPATCTRLPLTSWEAFWKRALTVVAACRRQQQHREDRGRDATSAAIRASGAVPRNLLLLPSRRQERRWPGNLRKSGAHTGRARRAGRPARRPPPAAPCRAPCGPTMLTREGAMRAALATSRQSASLALPSTGGAVTRINTAPSRSPAISSRRARGWSRTRSSCSDLRPRVLFEVTPRHERPRGTDPGPPAFHDGHAAADRARLVEQVLERARRRSSARRPHPPGLPPGLMLANQRAVAAMQPSRRQGDSCRPERYFVRSRRGGAGSASSTRSARMPGVGLEPTRPQGQSVLSRCVCQFRHPGEVCIVLSRHELPRLATLDWSQLSRRCWSCSRRDATSSWNLLHYTPSRRGRPARALAAAAAAVRRAPDRARPARQPPRVRGARRPLPVAAARLLPAHARPPRRTRRTCCRRSSRPPSTRSSPTSARSTCGRGCTGSRATARSTTCAARRRSAWTRWTSTSPRAARRPPTRCTSARSSGS